MQKQPENGPKTVYRCGTCDLDADMDFDQMMKHCEEVHGETVRGTKVEKSMSSHMDGADWYGYIFEVKTKSGLIFYQNQIFPRRSR